LISQERILLPVVALIGWTLLVLLLVPYKRLRAGLHGKATIADFQYGESARVPGDVMIPNRNFMNLIEVPVLFYVVCLMLFVTRHSSSMAVITAWVYVACRVLHSLVHLSYNNVIHRLIVFAVSNVVLLLIWARLLWELSR
jgi:hypothetical protein